MGAMIVPDGEPIDTVDLDDPDSEVVGVAFGAMSVDEDEEPQYTIDTVDLDDPNLGYGEWLTKHR
jgi:hypothetical protein